MSGKIEHVLRFCGETTALWLLRGCVFRSFPAEYSTSDIVRAYGLQRAFQQQYFRLTTENPNRVLEYAYRLNCPPVGFSVSPMTRRCSNPRVCPWCYVLRRLLPVYDALMEVPEEIRKSQDILIWRRFLPYSTADLPFLRSNYGPHQWCEALVTAQLVIPFIHERTHQLQLSHVGVQLVSSESDGEQQLVRRSVWPVLEVRRFKGATSGRIIKAMSVILHLPWLALADFQNQLQFQTLLDGFKKSRLMRITYYKAKEVEDAN